MKVKIIILVLTMGFISCKPERKSENINSNSKKDLNTEIKAVQNEKSVEKTQPIHDTIERFFPLEKETIKKDTLIKNLDIRISIVQNSLDSYVVDEFDSDGVKNIHKYRDSEHHLTINKGAKVLIDTIFKKDEFVENAGQQLIDISRFHGYWFNKIKDEQIELFGVISKPEGDDWTFAFKHLFDIRTGRFEIKESVDDEM
ncbi:DUF4738 domain-containing protein [uncultured Aquimarina sp.]|uniref:DUF4738 domain-containing protein n=1 Tax=uncultured Aquimarina sp. TaxID=575652 RepID=UPI0026279009|nr:DUF4738 domain-containing protein [uncultured Aquimarina sp.]